MEKQKNTPPNSVSAVVSAIYMLVLSGLNLCGALGFLMIASLGDMSELYNSSYSSYGYNASDFAALDAMSGFSMIGGLITLVLGIALLVAAVGLFMKKPWAYMLTIILNAVYVGFTILSALVFGGFNIVSGVFIMLSIIIIIIFMADNGTKAAYGKF